MKSYRFRILNVFTRGSEPFSGNPLCVFENAVGMNADTMQALTRQFNLSESTFIFPADTAGVTANVRIFTPAYEMAFAGHPTLGTAHVCRAGAGWRYFKFEDAGRHHSGIGREGSLDFDVEGRDFP